MTFRDYDLAELLRRSGEAMRRSEAAAAEARKQIERVDRLLDQLEAMRVAKELQPRRGSRG
jgi:hypothetical protein